MTPGPLMLIALIGAHLFLDYAGQGDFMAKAKNATAPIPGVPWWIVLWSHAAIHGAAAALITGFWPIFFAETGCHSAIDDAKCRNLLGFKMDQALHLACKVGWFAAVWYQHER